MRLIEKEKKERELRNKIKKLEWAKTKIDIQILGLLEVIKRIG